MEKRISWQIEWVQAFAHFQKARRILEVGSGNFETLMFLAKKYPGKQFVGIDFAFSDASVSAIKNAPPNLAAIKHDIRDLRLLANDQFDFVFSAAVLEHIRELESHLSAIHATLKRDGKYSFLESPFWSSSLGHHYEHNSPECPIPHYGHLMMSREQLKKYLEEHAQRQPAEIEKILRGIYEREDLSRLTRTETRAIVESSPFIIEAWKERLDKNYSEDLMKAVVGNNIYNVDAQDLQISGVTCTLRKSASPGNKSNWTSKILRKFGIR